MKVYLAPDWEPKEPSLTDRFFWPAIGLVAIGLFASYALLLSPLKHSNPNPPANSPTTTTYTTVSPRNSKVAPNSQQDELLHAPVSPLSPPQNEVSTLKKTFESPARGRTEGTYGPRGPPAVNGVAENGSYHGETSTLTGKPKTVEVRGYYRKDGTYVRGHYRSK
jgi:hypothetical protein